MNRAQLEIDATWRASEYVIAFEDTADRGRVRGSSYSPDGVLHRSNCSTLSETLRAQARHPACVYATTLKEFAESTRRHSGTHHRVCQRCCPGLIVLDARVEAAPSGNVVHLSEVIKTVTEHYIAKGGGLTVAELAAQLRCSETTARRVLARATEDDTLVAREGASGGPSRYFPSMRRLREVIRSLRAANG